MFIGQSQSQFKTIPFSVPQGSVLDPLLFLIYVNDITESLLSITRLVANDTSLATTTTKVEDLQGILNHDLSEITKWLKQWLVTFNPAKTEVLYFGNQTPAPLLNFSNDFLTSTDTHKHLGVTLSHDCKWHTNINNMLLSASRLIGIMRRLKYSVRRKTMNNIYIIPKANT